MKNNLKIITASIFISCLLLISCKKYEKELTIVQGTIVNHYSGLPVPDVKLRILYHKFGDDWDFRNNYWEYINSDTIAEFYSDAQGRFYYEFYAMKERNNTRLLYYYTCSKEGYCYQIRGGLIMTGQINDLFLDGYSHGYLQYHLINQNPFDVNDEICVYSRSDDTTPLCITGDNINGFYPAFINGWADPYVDTNDEIRWVVTKNGISTEYKDTVYRIPCDTTLFTIIY